MISVAQELLGELSLSSFICFISQHCETFTVPLRGLQISQFKTALYSALC